MTSDEQAIINFFGNIHAQAKQTDQQVVGNPQYIRPISDSIQQTLEQALKSPAPSPATTFASAPITPPPSYIPETPNPASFIYEAPQPPAAIVNSTIPLHDVLQRMCLQIERIADILENKNVRSPKSNKLKRDIS